MTVAEAAPDMVAAPVVPVPVTVTVAASDLVAAAVPVRGGCR